MDISFWFVLKQASPISVSLVKSVKMIWADLNTLLQSTQLTRSVECTNEKKHRREKKSEIRFELVFCQSVKEKSLNKYYWS